MPDLLIQNSIRLQSDGIEVPLDLQTAICLGVGKARIPSEESQNIMASITGQ